MSDQIRNKVANTVVRCLAITTAYYCRHCRRLIILGNGQLCIACISFAHTRRPIQKLFVFFAKQIKWFSVRSLRAMYYTTNRNSGALLLPNSCVAKISNLPSLRVETWDILNSFLAWLNNFNNTNHMCRRFRFAVTIILQRSLSLSLWRLFSQMHAIEQTMNQQKGKGTKMESRKRSGT